MGTCRGKDVHGVFPWGVRGGGRREREGGEEREKRSGARKSIGRHWLNQSIKHMPRAAVRSVAALVCCCAAAFAASSPTLRPSNMRQLRGGGDAPAETASDVPSFTTMHTTMHTTPPSPQMGRGRGRGGRGRGRGRGMHHYSAARKVVDTAVVGEVMRNLTSWEDVDTSRVAFAVGNTLFAAVVRATLLPEAPAVIPPNIRYFPGPTEIIEWPDLGEGGDPP